MAVNYSALKTEIAKVQYSGMDDSAIAASINNATGTMSVPVPALDVKRYLHLQGKWAAIALHANGLLSTSTDALKEAARTVCDALADFDAFDLTVPAYATAIEGALDAAATAGLITGPHGTSGTDAANIIAMGTVSVPLWQTFGDRLLDHGDIATARNS